MAAFYSTYSHGDQLTVRGIAESDFQHILKYMGNTWEPLRGKRVFFTGATGFVGKWMLEALIRANRELGLDCHATVLTRRPDTFISEVPHLSKNPCVELLRGDVRDFQIGIDRRWEYVVHAATDVSSTADPASNIDIFDVNVMGTRRVLDLARQSRSEGMLITSSGAVYGRVPSTMPLTSETYNGSPDSMRLDSAYGLGKRAAEWLATAYSSAYDIPVKIARIYALVGPYLPIDKHFAVGNFIKNKIAGEQILIHGDGTPHRSYLYAADLAVWLWTILIKGESMQAYNVGSDFPLSLGDLAYRVAKSGGGEVPVHIATKAPPNKSSEQYAPDISKAREQLGLDVRIELDEALSRTIDWHKRKN